MNLIGILFRHQSISLEMLLKLVRVFGSVIYSSLSASSSVGVDIEAEQRYDWIQELFEPFPRWPLLTFSFLAWFKRLERCNLCFLELEKVKQSLPLFCRCSVIVYRNLSNLFFVLEMLYFFLISISNNYHNVLTF